MIRFDLDKAAWQPQNIYALGETLCEFEHRFSKHSTDLRHVTVDPFRIILKQDATPVKQKLYHHSPVLAAKVRIEIYKHFAGGRSYLNWASPLVVVVESDGRIRLKCNYKNINKQHNSNISASSGLQSSLRTEGLEITQHDGTAGPIRPSATSAEPLSTTSASGAFLSWNAPRSSRPSSVTDKCSTESPSKLRQTTYRFKILQDCRTRAIENANANVLSRLPLTSRRRRSSAQASPDRPFGPRCLLSRCQRNSPLKPSNIVGLGVLHYIGHSIETSTELHGAP